MNYLYLSQSERDELYDLVILINNIGLTCNPYEDYYIGWAYLRENYLINKNEDLHRENFRNTKQDSNK